MREHVALAIDDRPEILDHVEEILTSLSHRCVRAETQEQAQAALEAQGFCYVLLDLELPVRANRVARVQTGYNLLEWIRDRHPADDLPVIVMTAHGTDHCYATKAFKRGATDFIKKPFDHDEQPMEDKIREALEHTCERHEICPNAGGAPASSVSPVPTPAAPAPEPAPAPRIGTRRRPVIRLVGFIKKRRYLVQVNGKELYVREASLTCLCRLAGALLNEPQPGWLDGRALGASPYNVIYRLKQDLGDSVDAKVIVNDGHGKYRLSVPPQNVEVAPALHEEHQMLAGILDGAG